MKSKSDDFENFKLYGYKLHCLIWVIKFDSENKFICQFYTRKAKREKNYGAIFVQKKKKSKTQQNQYKN